MYLVLYYIIMHIASLNSILSCYYMQLTNINTKEFILSLAYYAQVSIKYCLLGNIL